MGVSRYTAKRRKKSWTTHTKTGKPTVAMAKAQSWGVTRVTTPRLPREVSGYARRFDKGVQIEKSEHPELDQLSVEQLVRDHLRENPDYYSGHVKYMKGSETRHVKYTDRVIGFKTYKELKKHLDKKGLKYSEVRSGYNPIQKFFYEVPAKKGNPAEVRGQQLRIRVLEPKKRARYRVHDVGRRGRLQLTLMDGKVQSYAINLKDYESRDMVLFEIGQLRLTPSQKAEAVSLVNKYWRSKK
jgi:hypothetical protein